MWLVLEKILIHLDVPSLENAVKVSYGWWQAILYETKNHLRYYLVWFSVKIFKNFAFLIAIYIQAVNENWKKGNFNQFESDIHLISHIHFDSNHIVVSSLNCLKRQVNKFMVFDRSTLQLKHVSFGI